MDLTEMNWDELAERYVRTKKFIADFEKALQENPDYVNAKAVLAEIDAILMLRLETSGASSIKTPNGTIHTRGQTTARCEDPEMFRGFLRQTGDWSFADLRPNMTACRDYERVAGERVPGVVLSTFRWLSITATKTLKVTNG